jgi:hypothetical protein
MENAMLRGFLKLPIQNLQRGLQIATCLEAFILWIKNNIIFSAFRLTGEKVQLTNNSTLKSTPIKFIQVR